MRNSSKSFCADHTGSGDCAPFNVEHWDFTGGRINRPVAGYYAWKFDNYLADVLETPSNFPHHNIATPYTNTQFATMAAARTNPSRPYVDLPVSVLELGDITKLVRDSGRSLIRRLAGAHIKTQFGILPLASDVAKLTQLSANVDKRVQELERLRTQKGLRRTVALWNGSQSGNYSKSCQSAGYTINRSFSASTVKVVRGHTRWKPSTDMSRYGSPDAMRALAQRAVLGLGSDLGTTLSQAWELIPWSWLIDWGGNLGTFLKANRNIVPATLNGVHIMTHTRTAYQCSSFANASDGITMTGITFNRDNKERQPSFVSPTAHFPFLDGNQVGILASLSVLRGRR